MSDFTPETLRAYGISVDAQRAVRASITVEVGGRSVGMRSGFGRPSVRDSSALRFGESQ